LAWFLLLSTLLPTRDIDHHDLNPHGFNVQHIGGVLSNPTRGKNLNFCIFPKSQGSMTSQGMFEMHISLVVGKKLLMHRIVQSHPKLKFGLLFW
jgi:hypothetical protein